MAPTGERMGSLFGEDPQEHLDRVDRLLALVFLLPRRVKVISDEKERMKALGRFGEPLDELLHWFSDGWNLRVLVNRYRSPRNEFFTTGDLCLQPQAWVGGPEHVRRRQELIDLLLDVRAGIRRRLTVVVEPDVRSKAVPAVVPGEKLAIPRTWAQCTDRERSVLEVLAKASHTSKELAALLNVNDDALRHTLAALVNEGILGNTRGAGYWISTPPPGSPSAVTLAVPHARAPE